MLRSCPRIFLWEVKPKAPIQRSVSQKSEHVLVLLFYGDQLELTDKFKYPGNLITAGCGFGEESEPQIARIGADFTSLS